MTRQTNIYIPKKLHSFRLSLFNHTVPNLLLATLNAFPVECLFHSQCLNRLAEASLETDMHTNDWLAKGDKQK